MVKVEVKGLRELQAKLSSLEPKVSTEVRGVVENGAKVMVRNAKRDAPVNFGVLRNEISYYPTSTGKTIGFEVVSGARYSAYVEWGTITKVSVPAELQAYALEFKGRGLRKNGGMFPRPFFFKQIPVAKSQIEKGITEIIKSIK
jgi:HK97 gp10 family phage protein